MSILQLHKNEVEVLAKNGIDISKQAWMISRPNVTTEEMEDIGLAKAMKKAGTGKYVNNDTYLKNLKRK